MSVARHPGWLVWNPESYLPKVVHTTFASAEAEATRLSAAHPGENFVVMAPVRSAKSKAAEKAFSEGKAAGASEMHMDVVHAEAAADRLSDRVDKLKADLRHAQPIIDRSRAFQSIVADALLWFDGFAAAHSLREDFERPNIPNRHQLRELNAALLDLPVSNDIDEEIPF